MSRLSRIILRGHIWLIAAVIPVMVRLLPLKKLLLFFKPSAGFTPYRRVSPEEIGQMVRHRLRRPRSMRRRVCLREGLTLFYFLRLSGAPAVLNIAVHSQPDGNNRLRAHCWVVLDGVAMSEPMSGPGVTVVRCG